MASALAQLDSLFDPQQHHISDEGARIIVRMREDPETLAKMDILAEKANEGALSAEERREYEAWVRTGTFISILQAKARLYLKHLGKSL